MRKIIPAITESAHGPFNRFNFPVWSLTDMPAEGEGECVGPECLLIPGPGQLALAPCWVLGPKGLGGSVSQGTRDGQLASRRALHRWACCKPRMPEDLLFLWPTSLLKASGNPQFVCVTKDSTLCN